ncbi:DNA-binding transcriptional LysR family regulator [Paraburkholderia sp. UCT70]|uniref:LysR family transcriptional regulator n=1 Tax=Paraburkholderia sp. UCT70 TaxID=2991068 RepID=UPI003D211D5D
MNLKFLETFIWVAKLHSFSLAADKLHSTQAAISSRILALEQQLGVKLFARGPTGARLTRAGERVLMYAVQVSESMTRLRASVHDEKLAFGTIRIGAMDSAIHSWFVDFVADVMEQYPNLDIEVVTETALTLNEQLRRGMLDLIIQTDMLRDETIRSVELLELPFGWIAAADSRLATEPPAASPTAALRRLAEERLITYSRHSRPHQDLMRLMQSYGIGESRVSCVNSVAAMAKLIQAGFGVAAMPPAMVPDLLKQGVLCELEGIELPPPMPFVVAWRDGTDWTDRLVEVAIGTVRRYAERLGEHAARVFV